MCDDTMISNPAVSPENDRRNTASAVGWETGGQISSAKDSRNWKYVEKAYYQYFTRKYVRRTRNTLNTSLESIASRFSYLNT